MINKVMQNEKEFRTALAKDLRVTAEENGIPINSMRINENVKDFLEHCPPEEYPVYVFSEFSFMNHGFTVDLFSSTHYMTEKEVFDALEEFKKPKIITTNKTVTIKKVDVSDSVKDTL